MATCKDCIHNKACTSMLEALGYTVDGDGIYADKRCKEFEKKHGRWEECDWVEYDGHSECIHYPREGLVCTNCRNAFKKEFVNSPRVIYCPNCAAKMDLKG